MNAIAPEEQHAASSVGLPIPINDVNGQESGSNESSRPAASSNENEGALIASASARPEQRAPLLSLGGTGSRKRRIESISMEEDGNDIGRNNGQSWLGFGSAAMKILRSAMEIALPKYSQTQSTNQHPPNHLQHSLTNGNELNSKEQENQNVRAAVPMQASSPVSRKKPSTAHQNWRADRKRKTRPPARQPLADLSNNNEHNHEDVQFQESIEEKVAQLRLFKTKYDAACRIQRFARGIAANDEAEEEVHQEDNAGVDEDVQFQESIEEKVAQLRLFKTKYDAACRIQRFARGIAANDDADEGGAKGSIELDVAMLATSAVTTHTQQKDVDMSVNSFAPCTNEDDTLVDDIADEDTSGDGNEESNTGTIGDDAVLPHEVVNQFHTEHDGEEIDATIASIPHADQECVDSSNLPTTSSLVCNVCRNIIFAESGCCNCLDENSDGDEAVEGEEKWGLIEVIAVKDLKKKKPERCLGEGCTLAACTVWAPIVGTGGERWLGCIDCMEECLDGWPPSDEMPVKSLTDEHCALIAQKCSKQVNPPMPLLDGMNLPNTSTWDDVSKYRYISREIPYTYGKKRIKGKFIGSISYGTKSKRKIPPWGSSSASTLNLVIYDLARSSRVLSDGTIEWSRPLLRVSLRDWTVGMQNDLDVIPKINGSEDYMGRDDMKGGSVESALRAIAEKLLQQPTNVWKDCNREVLNFAAKALLKIARGEQDEFPWSDIASDEFDFPPAEEFHEANEKLHRQLNGQKKFDTKDILYRLCPPLFMCAQSISDQGHRSLPSYITKCHPSNGCQRMLCALYTFQAWFHGLLLDEDFVETIPLAHQHDPHAMPRKEKAKLMLKYLHSTGVCGELHTPIWIRIVLEGSDNRETELDVNAPEDEVQAMEAVMNEMLQSDDNMVRVREELAALDATESGLEQQAENRLAFVKQNGMEMLRLFDSFKNHSDLDTTLTEFQDRVDTELANIQGLEDLTHSDLPTVRAIDDLIWNDGRRRRDALGRATLEFLTLMKPPGDGKKRGQCSHANCNRNSLDYWSNFQWDHFKGKREGGKTAHPTDLARLSSDKIINEMRKDGGGGWVDVCGLHHDKQNKNRNFKAHISKWIKLVPLPVQERDDGKNFLEELLSNKRLCYQLTCLFTDQFIYGWNADRRSSTVKRGNFDTLRVVVYAYTGRIADDYILSTASQWNQGLVDRCEQFRQLFKYIIQDVSGTCAAATAAGTTDAERKPREEWNEGDYACKDFDIKNLPVLERQGVEGDHTKATSKQKNIAETYNLLNMTDEACHAPFHCYFCHKCRTKNQDRSSTNRNYTTC